jgi:hypothetical protein
MYTILNLHWRESRKKFTVTQSLCEGGFTGCWPKYTEPMQCQYDEAKKHIAVSSEEACGVVRIIIYANEGNFNIVHKLKMLLQYFLLLTELNWKCSLIASGLK